ncbi:MAG: galactitol-1-phosphate 5-dehydrogenase [candidate division KSB1 bacterium]|nr:galactitol-1-phosphate 5-dehydrogenase [candidate division KSB1 bacterium]
MKALVLTGINKLEYKEVPDPKINSDEVLVKVKAVGICGSDVHGMDGSSGRRQPPVIMGHEASGIIAETGSEVQGWHTGDQVTFDSTIYKLNDWYTLKGYYNLSDNRKVLGVSCDDYKLDGALAEYVKVPAHILHRIPDGVSFPEAAMVEPLAVAAHAVELTPIELNDTVVVIGAGMIGLGIIQIVKTRGAGQIIAVDLAQDKLDIAKRAGATYTLTPEEQDIHQVIQDRTRNRGADIAFEAVGISTTVKQSIDVVRRGGRVTLVGNVTPVTEFPLQSVVTRQIRVQGSCAICGEYPAVLDMLARKQIDVNPLLSVKVPLSEGAEWFHRLYNREAGLIKVILEP